MDLKNIIPKNDLLKMLKKEEELRFSKEYIDECTRVKDIPNEWLNVTSRLQEKVVELFGYKSDLQKIIALQSLRSAQYLYPNDINFQKTSVYVRNNLAKKGSLKIDDKIPNINIYDINKKIFNIDSIIKPNVYNIIFASSHT